MNVSEKYWRNKKKSIKKNNKQPNLMKIYNWSQKKN